MFIKITKYIEIFFPLDLTENENKKISTTQKLSLTNQRNLMLS